METGYHNNVDPKDRLLSALRIGVAIAIIILTLVYVFELVTGHVPEKQKIDLVTLGIISLAALVSYLLIRPGAFDRLKKFEMKGFKFEMLEKVKEKQAEQESRLDDIALMLPLLLPKSMQGHLLNIAGGKNTVVPGSHSIRSELRRLREAGLIKSVSGVNIKSLADGSNADLLKIVEITALGRRWVKRINEIEEKDLY